MLTFLIRLGELFQGEYDGPAQLSNRSLADSEQSPAYAKALAPDCAHFMAMPISVAVGYDNLIFGEAAPNLDGKDGLTNANVQQRSEE